MQYLQTYSDGFLLNKFQGDALYLGPRQYVRLTDRLFFTGAFSAQITGHSTADPRPLDLSNFSLHRPRSVRRRALMINHTIPLSNGRLGSRNGLPHMVASRQKRTFLHEFAGKFARVQKTAWSPRSGAWSPAITDL